MSFDRQSIQAQTWSEGQPRYDHLNDHEVRSECDRIPPRTTLLTPTHRILPREVDPLVYNMSIEDPGSASFAGIGGLSDQVRELREVRITPHANTDQD